MLSLLDDSKPQKYIPAGFFIHFDPMYHKGQAAIDKHLEYFRYTGMDFVKIQYEKDFRKRGLPDVSAAFHGRDGSERDNRYRK